MQKIKNIPSKYYKDLLENTNVDLNELVNLNLKSDEIVLNSHFDKQKFCCEIVNLSTFEEKEIKLDKRELNDLAVKSGYCYRCKNKYFGVV